MTPQDEALAKLRSALDHSTEQAVRLLISEAMHCLRSAPSRPTRSWEPHPSAVERARANATFINVDMHIDRYNLRCRELGKTPSNEEWLRWFFDDEQKALIEAKTKAMTQAPIDDIGVPNSWS